jgi:hypothetical protein
LLIIHNGADQAAALCARRTDDCDDFFVRHSILLHPSR